MVSVTQTLSNIFRMRPTTIKQEKEDGGKAERARSSAGRAGEHGHGRPLKIGRAGGSGQPLAK